LHSGGQSPKGIPVGEALSPGLLSQSDAFGTKVQLKNPEASGLNFAISPPDAKRLLVAVLF